MLSLRCVRERFVHTKGDTVATSVYLGELLDERFELQMCLGEGGSGTVWLARDHRLGISVAVKILRASLRQDTERRAEFERESELCARMLSPHIVRVLSRGVGGNDRPFIVYELLEGETLDQRILRDGPLSLDDTETVVVHVARALARAHSMSIVHKDIKPGNVFLTKDDQGRLLVKVLDFGIAEMADGRTGPTESICGTLEYMPREVLVEGLPASDRGDLYALAAVTYECLTGAAPFAGGSLLEMVLAMCVAPPSLSAFFPVDAAGPLDAWLRRGLAPTPDDRFGTARELVAALHQAVNAAKATLGILPRRSSGTRRLAAPRVPAFSEEEAVDSEPVRMDSLVAMRSTPTVEIPAVRATIKLARNG